MDNSLVMHIFQRVEKLMQEESAGVLAHLTHGLAQVEEETALDELHDDEDEVVDDATGWFDDLSSVAVFVHTDDAEVVQIFENGYLVVDRKNGVGVAAKELFFQNFDRCVPSSCELSAQVDLRGVAFAERLEDLVLAIEDGMLLCLSSLHFELE